MQVIRVTNLMSIELKTQLFHKAEDYFFRSISDKCLNIGDGVTAYMTGVPVPSLNILYVTNNLTPIEQILKASLNFFGQGATPFEIIISEINCTPEVINKLSAIDYSQIAKTVAMGIDLDLVTEAYIASDYTILANDQNLRDWSLPLIEAFESTANISAQYANAHQCAIDKGHGLHHFSLYIDGNPISSVTISIHNKLARIDDVGTLPEFQNKGCATRLINYALVEAKKLGATHCFLEASDSGFSVYQKIGFQIIFQNNIYSITTEE